jgi:Flp pilus assembly protein TadG
MPSATDCSGGRPGSCREVPRWPAGRASDDTRSDPSGENGSATVEFVLLSALLLVPVVYFLVLTSQIQSAAYASVAAADQAAKAMVSAPDEAEAAHRADRVVALTLGDYGLDPATHRASISCTSTPCLEPGSSVAVQVAIRVPVPLLPQGLGWDAAVATVTSSSQQPVPRFG